MDYSKFEKLADQLDADEKREKEERREKLRLKYEKEQKEKQDKWEQQMIKEGKDPVKLRQQFGGCTFNQMSYLNKMKNNANNANNHNHNHPHSHDHDHNHNHNNSTPQSSCGYMSVDQMKKLAEQKKKQKTLTLQEKNKKKIIAVYAAKEDGNRCFKEGKYDLAYKIYERGVLIINGMYQLSDKQETEMEHIESLLNLNMAAVSLKLSNWTEAINCCQMAIQIDDQNAKAYYRWSEALIGMSEYKKAKIKSLKAKELMPNMIAIDRQINKIDKLYKQQMDKAKLEQQKMSKRISKKLNQSNDVSDN